jgi:glutathione S-transferase
MHCDSSLILYTHPLSANGRKVMANVYLHKMDIDIRLVNVYQGEGQHPDYLKINPLGQIPALVDKAAGITLRESNFIMMYLAQHDGRSHYYPPERRMEIIQWLFWEAAQWQPALCTILRGAVAHKLLPALFPKPVEEVDWDEPAASRMFAFLSHQLSKSKYLAGKQLTIADLTVAGMMTYFRIANFPYDKYPAIRDWYCEIQALDAWQRSASECWEIN